jgi:hypothetical protein
MRQVKAVVNRRAANARYAIQTKILVVVLLLAFGRKGISSVDLSLAAAAGRRFLFAQNVLPTTPAPQSVPATADTEPRPDAPRQEVANPVMLEPMPILPPPPQILADDALFPDLMSDAGLSNPAPAGFRFQLHGTVKVLYDSNIFIQPSGEKEDFIFTIAPGMTLGWGDYEADLAAEWSFRDRYDPDRTEPERLFKKNFVYLDYTPSVTLFARHSEEDTFDHDARIGAQWAMKKLTLGIKLRFQTLNLPDVDVGDRQRQWRLNVALTSLYDISDKTNVEVNFEHLSRNYERNSDTREWKNQNWLNYQIRPKVNIGVGGALGYVESTDGPEQYFQQGVLRVRYKPSEKLSLTLVGGVETRQVKGGDDQVNPVASLSVTWKPYDGTYLYVNGFSRTQTSAARGQNYTATGFDLLARQRFYQRYYVALAAGYANAAYDDLPNSTGGSRTDDLFYVRPSVEMDVTRWLSATAAVEIRRNDSTDARRSFDELTAYLQFSVYF